MLWIPWRACAIRRLEADPGILRGFFLTFAAGRVSLNPLWRLLVVTGFVGAYTTFSTFEYETQRLTESGALWWGAFNVIASITAGSAAVQLGVFLAR